MVHAPPRYEPSEDLEGFGKGKTFLSTFMPKIMIPMVKKVPPIPTKVMVTPKDILSMKISFQPKEQITHRPTTSPGNSAGVTRLKSTKAIPVLLTTTEQL
jgi:predicted ATPase with chaperone activity